MNDQPLVSMALFAYNQEDYINDAIDAAFSQNYGSLEIILSDDGSTDNTYNIIQQRVEQYIGPHHVRARQSLSNSGTLRHVLEVARESKGDFLVLATGDDIQLPERTGILVDAWKRSGATAFSTAWHIINDEGKLLERHVRPEAPRNLVWRYFSDPKDRQFMSGPTAAYDPKFLRDLPLPSGKVFHEDTVFTFALHLLGLEINYTDEPTVKYRVHEKSYSNRSYSQSSFSEILVKEKANASYAKDTASYLNYLINDFIPYAFKRRADIVDSVNLDFMRDYLRKSEIESSWIDFDLSKRLSTLAKARSISEFKTILARIFGLNALAFAKSIILKG